MQGVIPYSISLFFSKLVNYTFLYWLPYYISKTRASACMPRFTSHLAPVIDGKYYSSSESAYLSTLFNFGGIAGMREVYRLTSQPMLSAGSVLTGFFSDYFRAPALVCSVLLYVSVPTVGLPSTAISSTDSSAAFPVPLLRQLDVDHQHRSVRPLQDASYSHPSVLLFINGIIVNGPYSLMTTAISADLGNHRSLKGNGRALATVSAIIDGTGSIGKPAARFAFTCDDCCTRRRHRALPGWCTAVE